VTLAVRKITRNTAFFVLVITILGSWSAAARYTRPIGWQPPPGQPTCAALTLNQVSLSAAPNFGTVAPTVIVPATTVVGLHGIAQKFRLLADCTHTTTPLSPFTWRLTFQPAGGVLGPSPVALQHSNTLSPSLNVGAQAGAYDVQLIVGKDSAEVRIEVIPEGIAWYTLGPDGLGTPWIGRISVLAFDPSHPSTLYAGSGRGGVWRSPDRGLNWWPMSDQKLDSMTQNQPAFNSLGIGALAVAPDGTVYAGVGDWTASNTNGFGEIATTLGIVKSTDGGIHWTSVGTTAPTVECIGFTGQAKQIAVDPGNSSLVYVAATNGVFRSFDGGQCWRLILAGSFSDAVIDPMTPTSMFVAALPGTPAAPSGGIIRLDGVDINLPRIVPSIGNVATFMPLVASGNPQTWLRIAFRFAPADSNTAYAAFISKADAFIAKSRDHLTSLFDVSFVNPIVNGPLCSGRCGPRNGALAIAPDNPNMVFYGGTAAFESSDGGATWTNITSNAHPDQLWMTFAPDDPNTLYLAGDGGISSIPANSATTSTWTPLNHNLGVAQSMIVASAPADSTHSAFGSWDTGTQARLSGRSWTQPGGGDGFNASFDASSDATTFYGDCDANLANCNQMLRFPDDLAMGASITPIANPLRGGELFHVGLTGQGDAFWRIYATRNANSTTATPAYTCVDPNPSQQAFAKGLGFLANGSYYLNYSDGSLFTFTLPQLGPPGPCSRGTSAQSVTQILPTNTSPGFLILAVDPFNGNQLYGLSLPPNKPSVVFTVPLTANSNPQQLPGRLPPGLLTGAMAADPTRRGVIYLGTMRGLLVGAPDSAGNYQWSLDANLPDARVGSIDSNRNVNGFTGDMEVSLFGRGIWQMLRTSPCPRMLCFRGGPAVECLTCVQTSAGAWLGHSVSGAGPTATLMARFFYSGGAGPKVLARAVPLANGVALPFFASEIVEASIGENEAPLSLFYAAANAPLGVHTDAVRFELLVEKTNRTVASFVVPFDHWWLKSNGRLVSVVARNAAEAARDTTGTALHVRIRVKIDGQPPVSGITPFMVPAPLGARAAVFELRSEPSTANSRDDGYRHGSHSHKNQHGDAHNQQEEVTHDGDLHPLVMWTLDQTILGPLKKVMFSVNRSHSVVAYYAAEQRHQPEPH
jgi:hypothetical protein